jgi:hypothetical protein
MRDSWLAHGHHMSHHGDDCGASEGHTDQGEHDCGTSAEYGAHGGHGDYGNHDHESAHSALMASADDAGSDETVAPQESALAAHATAGGPGATTTPASAREVTSDQMRRLPDFGPPGGCSCR